jgi:hypothetical protein
MTETNIKIVNFGENLHLLVKEVVLESEGLNPKQMRAVCAKLRNRYRVAATPCGNSSIYVPIWFDFPEVHINIDGWLITPKVIKNSIKLEYSNSQHRKFIGDLYKQALFFEIQKTNLFWTIENESNRIFYENKPFFEGRKRGHEVNAFRRFEVSELEVEGVGLGISVVISTSFFSTLSIEEFFEENKAHDFDRISLRQNEQKGTLLYVTPESSTICYFEKYLEGKTLSTTKGIEVKGKYYETPYQYFKERYPTADINPNDKVAIVSFKNMEIKVPVPAKMLYPRVMNDALPAKLTKMAAIEPSERKSYLENNFWNKFGSFPFGKRLADLNKNYYVPHKDNCGIIRIPNFIFGNKSILSSPQVINQYGYKIHFRQRMEYLEKHGCFFVPPIIDGSELFFVLPNGIHKDIVDKYQKDITEKIKSYTKTEIDAIVLSPYSGYLEGVYDLKNNYNPSTVIFVFENNDPATYFHIDYELQNWKLKRATTQELIYKYKKLDQPNGKKSWDSYIEMTALGVIQQMGCIPYVVDSNRFNYAMHLLIDVSEERTHYAISLQIWKQGMVFPIFPSRIKRNIGGKETINPVLLKDLLLELFKNHANEIKRYNIANMLAFRDGVDCGEEYSAILDAVNELKIQNILPNEFNFDFAEYHKSSRKGIKLWNNYRGEITNPLEGNYLLIGKNTAILTPTGCGTLTQGTSDPLIIQTKYTQPDMNKVLEDIFLSSQFNFSSPKVAQRLMLTAKRTDELLQEKRAQEIKRINK